MSRVVLHESPMLCYCDLLQRKTPPLCLPDWRKLLLTLTLTSLLMVTVKHGWAVVRKGMAMLGVARDLI